MSNLNLEIIKEKALNDHVPIIMDNTLNKIKDYMKNRKINKILEIGTAVGYSAICFTEFLEKNGVIDTIERNKTSKGKY